MWVKNKNLHDKFNSATKWSAITEVVAKLVSPVTNMILARILVPEAFGVVATVTMIISFAEMFADSGFQKYLVQQEFKNEEEKYKYANVAFLINLVISILLWFLIVIFRDQLANFVGNPGLGNVLAIASLQLPIISFSSIQMALYRRDFNFKTLFLVRLITVFIPLVVTVPLAFLGLSYWALIIGTIFMQISNAVILNLKSNWKPKLFYSNKIFKKMYSFSIWSLIEAISIWLTAWVDMFIIAGSLNQYYLGVYRTSISMVNQLMSLITASTVPVLYSALSRLQDDKKEFTNLYFKVQRFVSILILPLGVGLFLYSDLATNIFLGSQWSEASNVIGIWSLTSAVTIVFGHFSSEVYRAKGRPKLSFLAQILHLVVLVPTCIISSKYGFWTLIYARSLIRIQMVLVHFVIMEFSMRISTLKTFKNVCPTIISSLIMGIFGYLLKQINESIYWSVLSIIICVLIYFGTLSLFPNMRVELINLTKKILPKRVLYKFNNL